MMWRRIGYRRKGKRAHEKGCSRFPYRGVMGVTIRAPAAAVKAGRDRGPSVTHRLAKEQAAEAAAAEQKKAKKPSTKKARGAALGLAGVAAAGIVYGRVRLHSSPHSAVNATGEERRTALMGKGWARRTVHVHGVTPSGDAVLEAVDDVRCGPRAVCGRKLQGRCSL